MTETFDLDALIARAEQLDAALTRRDRVEVGVSAGLAVVFAGFAVHAAVWMEMGVAALGLALLALACVRVGWTVRQRGRAPAADPAADLRSAHRAELAHQIALLRDVPRWYLAPFLPGFVVFLVGPTAVDALSGASVSAAAWGTSWAVLGSVLAVYGGVWALNHREAGRLQAELDALDADLPADA